MGKTIAKSKIFSVTVEVSDERLRQLKKAPEVVEKALEAAADWWRTGILPGHFERGAAAKYGYAPRSKAYVKKYPNANPLVRTGAMKADLLARAALRMQGRTLTMQANRLNFCPRMGDNDQDLYVTHSNRKANGYPNMKREIRLVTDAEREQLANIMAAEIEKGLAPKAD
jgi:hypothetical protein